MSNKKKIYLTVQLLPKDGELLGYSRQSGMMSETKDHIETWYSFNNYEVGFLFGKIGLHIQKKKD